jgi:hypothetical protein
MLIGLFYYALQPMNESFSTARPGHNAQGAFFVFLDLK